MTCEDYLKEQKLKFQHSAEINKSIKWCNNNTKLCPKCKIKIQRNGGCDEMRCSRCKFKFYWYNAIPCNERYLENKPALKTKYNFLEKVQKISKKLWNEITTNFC